MTAEPMSLVCRRCGVDYMVTEPLENDLYSLCRQCFRRYPPSLLKAFFDMPWTYALRLITGEVIIFSGARAEGLDYVHLDEPMVLPTEDDLYEVVERGPGHFHRLRLSDMHDAPTFERSMDVRLDSIVWCVDAPYGS